MLRKLENGEAQLKKLLRIVLARSVNEMIEWGLSISLEADFCVSTLKNALSTAQCEIFNTDQGSQFTSIAWIDVLKEANISISMDGRGRYLDNIFVERLWRSVKQECIYLRDFSTLSEVRATLSSYFEYYNHPPVQTPSATPLKIKKILKYCINQKLR
jgi:putative transposase